jgi:rfaE bifunctional protein kinase chain/domain
MGVKVFIFVVITGSPSAIWHVFSLTKKGYKLNQSGLKKLLASLKNISIAVIGDFFLDKYLEIDRSKKELSIETGLEAFQVVNKRMFPGAAGTITNNLRSLGVGRIITLGFIGDDGEGFDLLKGLEKSGVETRYLIKTTDRVTPTYVKPVIMENNGLKEINRLDIKNFTITPPDLENEMIKNLRSIAKDVDGVIALDQLSEDGCGVLTKKVRKALSKLERIKEGLVVYADSRHHIGHFENVIIKCNHIEAVRNVFGSLDEKPDKKTIEKAGQLLWQKTIKPVFITHGEHGQWVFDGSSIKKIPGIKVEGPIDIVGAGDANTSGIVSALCSRTSPEDAALFGNIVSSIAIQQLNTTGIVTPEDIIKRYNEVFGKR